LANPAKQLPPLQRAIVRATGARLCFGAPVELGKRTVIPVASLRTAGGWGFGNDPQSGDRLGGGGGGAIDARPVGFIEITPDGARFQRIYDGRMALRALAVGSLAVLVAGRVVRRRRIPPALLARVPLPRRLGRGGSAQASQPS